jgi:CBS domain containing-hemolysin-like protein
MADTHGHSNGAAGRISTLIDKISRRLRGANGTSDVAEGVAEAIEQHEERGEQMGPAQKAMLHNAARFNDKLRVSEVMRPRAHIVALEVSATVAEAAQMFAESQHSRLPLYRETLDDPLGFIHVKDLMTILVPDETGVTKSKMGDRTLMRLRRDTLFVPPSMPLPNLLMRMKAERIHMALVIDEYGGTHGLVTIEDIVEQIVGAIDDEHDEAEAELVLSRGGGIIEADGRALVADVAALMNADLSLEDHEDEVATIAGLAAALATHVPQRGEVLHHPAGIDLEVLDADPRRVKRVRLRATLVSQREEAGA